MNDTGNSIDSPLRPKMTTPTTAPKERLATHIINKPTNGNEARKSIRTLVRKISKKRAPKSFGFGETPLRRESLVRNPQDAPANIVMPTTASLWVRPRFKVLPE